MSEKTQTIEQSDNQAIKIFTNSKNTPRFDAEDLAHGLQRIRYEEKGTGFVSREKGGTAVVVEVKGDVGGAMRGEVVIEIGGVDGWDGDVLCIVEKIDGFEGTGCPPLAQVVDLHSGKEPLRNGGLEIEHGGCDIVCHDKRADKGVNLLAGVAFAEHPFVDVA